MRRGRSARFGYHAETRIRSGEASAEHEAVSGLLRDKGNHVRCLWEKREWEEGEGGWRKGKEKQYIARAPRLKEMENCRHPWETEKLTNEDGSV